MGPLAFAGLGLLEVVIAPSSVLSYVAKYSPDADRSKSGNFSFVFEEDDQRRSALAEGMVNVELMRCCRKDLSYAVCGSSFRIPCVGSIAHEISN